MFATSTPRRCKGLSVLFCGVVGFSAAITNCGWAQETAAYFKANCSSCHTIGGGRLTGPDLKRVVERAGQAGKDRDWLIAYIQDPQRMINSGDAYAAKLVQEARGVVMVKIVDMDAEKAGFLVDLIEAESLLEESQFKGKRVFRAGPRITNALSNPYEILNSEFLQKDLNLTKEQIDRVRQYNLQHEGIRALSRNDVARELGFTTVQKRMIAAVYEAYDQKRINYETRRQTSEDVIVTRQEYHELIREFQNINQKVMEVLTEVQRQQFDKMKGKPFDSRKLYQAQDSSPKKSPDPDGAKVLGLVVQPTTWATPRLTPEEVLAVRLPDVRITSAKYYKANEKPLGPRTQNRIQVSHLDVRGVIGGSIQFELLLPDKWNNRFVMGGGGAFVGTLANQARYTINRGYATVGTDTGHQSVSGLNAEWALNDLKARLNFAYLAVHRTAEVAKAIIHTYYGAAPKYSYFSGCSNGGRQALITAQRYPDDFDGIISAAPPADLTSLWAAGVSNAQHFFPDPAKLDQPIISKAALDRLYAEVIRQCDHQDGVKDGILDDPRICRFDWSECNWLTPSQIRAIKSVYAGPMNGQIHPGLPIGSEDQWYQSKAGSFANTLTQEEAPNFEFAMKINGSKYMIFNDPNWDYSKYDLSKWQHDTRLHRTHTTDSNPDLSKFRARGGKLIVWHGWADTALTPLASINYFEEVEKRDPDVRDFFRLFLLPGVRHCGGGTGPDKVDWIAVISRWVEEDSAPDRIVASKANNSDKVIMSRPVYPYPLRAVYKGMGNINSADNFALPKK